MPERVSFPTVDGVTIIGTWNEAVGATGAAVLLHMMPATRASWAALQAALAGQGLSSLAIDLRGHGESTRGAEGTLAYKGFTDEQHQASRMDVEAAVNWLRAKGLKPERIVLIGASIGANLALSALADEPRLPAAVLLSPGADYHGLKALEEAEGLNPEQALYILASADDATSFSDSRRLRDMAPVERKTLVELTAAGHGTTMLEGDPTKAQDIATWAGTMLRS
jgi:dienelactone hydrolase